MSLDPSGRLVLEAANPAASKILGVDVSQRIGIIILYTILYSGKIFGRRLLEEVQQFCQYLFIMGTTLRRCIAVADRRFSRILPGCR